MKHVIVGGSAAGISAAKTIRENDPDAMISVVCKDKYFYSRCQLHFVASGKLSPDKIRLSTPDWAEKMKVSLNAGKEVSGLDAEKRRIIFEDGGGMDYDRLLIASGARTVFPPIEGISGPGTFALRSMEDALEIKGALGKTANTTIIGAGLIGVELATELLEAGFKVNIVEIADRPLPLQLEDVCGEKCAKLLAEKGAKLFLGKSVKKISRNSQGKIIGAELSTGEIIASDLIVCAAGVKANFDFALQAGIKAAKGICIDKYCATNLPGVYAAGDVTEFEDSISGVHQMTAIWPTAVRQGKIAGANMLGGSSEINIVTALKASVSLFGTHAISLGNVSSPMKSWTKHVFRATDSRGMENIRILYTEGKLLKAALLWGDVANAGLYHETIVKNRDISADLAWLGSFDAAKRGQEKLSVL